ncbi:hypothetical protein [Methylomicrobium sp. Wu6]|nr:hypothetical protein [Methylomicrobium sp. Wu6]MEC4749008.1 hypothetical protein [Methylomicrobium sp. Wu6]
MGAVGWIIITRCSYALVKGASPVFHDEKIDSDYRQAIVEWIEG